LFLLREPAGGLQSFGGKMKKRAFGTSAVSVIVLGIASASAAELPVPTRARSAPQAAYSWTGCYLGLQGAVGTEITPFTLTNRAGGLAGGQIGCNYQSGQIVLGLEAEAAWSNLTDRSDSSSPGLTSEANARNRWTADLAARGGVAVDRALIYGKIGVAQGGFAFSNASTNTFFTNVSNFSGALTGVIFGAGLEYAFAPNWSARLEYDHIDYVGRSFRFFDSFPLDGMLDDRQSASANLVKAAINYRFAGSDVAPAIEWQVGPAITKAPPPVAYNWTGCYGGVQAGGGTHTDTFSLDQNNGGGLAGGQIGCNYQIGQIVVGAEGEAAWSGVTDNGHLKLIGFSEEAASRNRWIADVSARAGVALDRALVYGKAGLAEGGFASNSTVQGVSAVGSGTLSGLLLGLGLEYAFAPNWSARLEYDHIDYFGRDLTFNGVSQPSAVVSQSATTNVVKGGIDYRFTGADRAWLSSASRLAPSYNWSGCYAGAQGGGGVQNGAFAGINGGGGLAGGQAGCNYQSGQIVFGIEGEAAWSSLQDKNDFAQAGFSQEFAIRNHWTADLAARGGVAVDRALIYGKAGVAQGGFAFSSMDTTGNFTKASGTFTGVLLGGGIEYAFAPNWSAKFEFDHITYVGRDLLFTGIPSDSIIRESVSASLVKVGINYHFAGGNTIVAKY
jgi:outer membrane immunogenic protein